MPRRRPSTLVAEATDRAATTVHLTPAALAARWQLSPRTLANQRYLGVGPAWIKVGGSVRYTVAAVEAYEAEQLTGAA